MPHILVADKIAEEGLERMRRTEGVTFDVKHGLSPEALAVRLRNQTARIVLPDRPIFERAIHGAIHSLDKRA